MQIDLADLRECFPVDSLQEPQRSWIYEYIETIIKDGHLISNALKQHKLVTETDSAIKVDFGEVSFREFSEYVFLLIDLCCEKLVTKETCSLFRSNPLFPQFLIKNSDFIIPLLKINHDMIAKLSNNDLAFDKLRLAVDFLKAPESLSFCKIFLDMQRKAPSRDFLSTLAKIIGTKAFQELNVTSALSKAENVLRLLQICSDLEKNKLLNEDSLTQAIQRMTIHLPKPNRSTVVKMRRKDTGAPYSQLLVDANPPIFLDSKLNTIESIEEKGPKKGYDSVPLDKPVFLIKKKDSDVIREVKYHRLLGRKAFHFFNEKTNKTILIADWTPGKSLDLFQRSELNQLSFALKIRCLSTAMSDLNILHRHYRQHGDIKPENVILNPEGGSLKLIDFDVSHKIGKMDNYNYGYTSLFTEPDIFIGHLAQDLYAMGMVVMVLFPELYFYRVDYDSEPVKARAFLVNASLTVTEQAVVNLVNALRHPELNMRCTSEDALNYCNELLHNIDTLNEISLAAITESTIARTNTTIEDALRQRAPR